MHAPVIDDFAGSPFAEHDYACPVCQQFKAIYNMNNGVFEPCEVCSNVGWKIVKKKFHRSHK